MRWCFDGPWAVLIGLRNIDMQSYEPLRVTLERLEHAEGGCYAIGFSDSKGPTLRSSHPGVTLVLQSHELRRFWTILAWRRLYQSLPCAIVALLRAPASAWIERRLIATGPLRATLWAPGNRRAQLERLPVIPF